MDAQGRGLTRDELSALLAINRAIGRHLHRDELFGALATCLGDVVPTDRFGIELPIAGDRLQGHLLTPMPGATAPTQPSILPAMGTACDYVLRQREWIVVDSREELRERFPITFDVMQGAAMESVCALPLVIADQCRGVLFFMSSRTGAYRSLPVGFLEQVAAAVAVALDDCLAHEEVQRLRDQLAAENVYLQEEIRDERHFGEIVGDSGALRTVLTQIERVAPTNTTVLILGETGTGKELIARAVHDRSPRHERPLVKVNCAAISAGLVESELFGHVRGAFTGAVGSRTGRFELADGGTIFLDEVGELPLDTQVKLLRILQERTFEPVGSSQSKQVDVRVLAATNRDLEQEVAAGRFRADLFYRLNVVPIRVPPLRERREDIPALVHYLVSRLARDMAKPVRGVGTATLDRMIAYDWPGNIRELQNVLERAVVLATGPELEVDLGASTPPATIATPAQNGAPTSPTDSSAPLDEVARRHMIRVLEDCRWRIDGPDGAAHTLGLKPSTLRSRMKKLGLERPTSESRA